MFVIAASGWATLMWIVQTASPKLRHRSLLLCRCGAKMAAQSVIVVGRALRASGDAPTNSAGLFQILTRAGRRTSPIMARSRAALRT